MLTDLSRRGLIAGGAGLGLATLAGDRSRAAAPDTAALNAWVAKTAAANNIPGLSAVAIRGGKPEAFFNYGVASLPFQVPVTDRTLFHTGSVGKHITSVALMRLVDAGELKLDVPIGTYAKELPDHLASRPLRTLLSHTSGFPTYGPNLQWDRPLGRKEFHKLMAENPAQFDAGAAWSYSNTAFVQLGYVIEDVAGKDYARVIAEDLFRPLGMQESRVDDTALPIPLRAEPYTRRNGAYHNALRMSTQVSSVAAGGILMSMREVAPWVAALHGGKLLSAAAYQEMSRPIRLNSGRTVPYGMGWMLDALPDGGLYRTHTGSVPGFRTYHIQSPAKDFALMLVTNADNEAYPVIGMKIAETLAPGSTPLSLKPIRDKAPLKTAAAKAMVTRNGGKLDLAAFAPEMLVNLEAGRNSAVWQVPASALPDLQNFTLVQEDRDKNGLSRRRYQVVFPDRTLHVSFYHLADGRIYYVRGI